MASDTPKAVPMARRLGFLRDQRFHYAAGALCFPFLGWLSWYSQKYAMAQAGPAANATGQAISEVATFFSTLCSCGLLPLTSLLTAANQAKDPARLLGLIGAGLWVGLVVGILGEAVLLWAAPSVLLVFESQQPLLPEAPSLSRIFNAAFACQVLDGALVGALFGLDEHLFVLACLMPLMVVSLLLTSVFLFVMDDLAVLMIAQPINSMLYMVLLATKLRAIIMRLHGEKHAASGPQALAGSTAEQQAAPSAGATVLGRPPSSDADAGAAASNDPLPPDAVKEEVTKLLESVGPTSAAPPQLSWSALLRDLVPSDQVWRDMLFATSGNSVRNLALSLKSFLCVVFATRLGNVPGSAFSLQQTLGRHLAGPAGFIGLGATMAAPRLLEKKNISFFLVLLRSIRNLILICVAVWFFFVAWSGPEGVLASVGINGDIAPAGGAGLAGTREEYLLVLTPLNHVLWAVATMLNEIAAPYDGVLMSLKLYSFLGAIYAGNLFLILLPGLYLTQAAVAPPLVNGDREGLNGHGGVNGHSSQPASFAGYSGIMLVLVLWSAMRLVGCVWGVYWLEVPRQLAALRTLEAGCKREVLLKWVRHRCECPEEEFQAEMALLREKSPGEEREAFRRRDDGPLAVFAREHQTTVTAMEAMGQRLYADGDKELQELVHKMVFRERFS